MSKKSMIIIHHAGKGGERSTFKSIRHTHTVTRGYRAVAYHKVIERSGIVCVGRKDRSWGAHTIGRDDEDELHYNRKALGVCLCGNFDKNGVGPAQWNALVRVVTRWCEKHTIVPSEDTIVGHKDKQPKKKNRKTGELFDNTCPGANVYSRLPNLRVEVAASLQHRRKFSTWDDVEVSEFVLEL